MMQCCDLMLIWQWSVFERTWSCAGSSGMITSLNKGCSGQGIAGSPGLVLGHLSIISRALKHSLSFVIWAHLEALWQTAVTERVPLLSFLRHPRLAPCGVMPLAQLWQQIKHRGSAQRHDISLCTAQLSSFFFLYGDTYSLSFARIYSYRDSTLCIPSKSLLIIPGISKYYDNLLITS